jgi:ribosome maturation factor RimP
MNKTEEIVRGLALPVVERSGCSLWDVEYLKEGGQWYLKVYIDNDEGVTIDQCEQVSRELEVLLDRDDPVPTSYILEVSSAGLERALKRPADFEKFLGHLVEVSLFKPAFSSKTHLGKLTAFDNGNVEIESSGGALRFEASNVAQVRLRLEF